jgi:hypothetical protein
MSIRTITTGLFLTCLLFALHSQTAVAKNLYKWVNEDGSIVFSDQIPPEQTKNQHEVLSPSGKVVELVEQAKTTEQLELEKRLVVLRAEQQKIIEQQKARDSLLLATFRSKEDMNAAFNTKIQTIEAEKKALEGQLTRLFAQFEVQQTEAAGFERNAQKVSEKLLADMKQSQADIKKTNDDITANANKRKKVQKEHDADFDRFVFLTKKQETIESDVKTASIKEANSLGLFYCENDHLCDKAWEIAHKFIQLYSTTEPDVDNDKLIMHKPAINDADLSLSLSRIAINDSEYQLFLDIHCNKSTNGRKLCDSQRVQQIRSSFRPYINDTLANMAKQ